MHPKSIPLSLGIQFWEGIGFFLELECPELGLYSLYWVPEKRLDSILEAMCKQIEDLSPLVGGKIVLNEDEKPKPKKDEGISE